MLFLCRRPIDGGQPFLEPWAGQRIQIEFQFRLHKRAFRRRASGRDGLTDQPTGVRLI